MKGAALVRAEQRKAFDMLKKHLSMAETLGYFDIHTKIYVIPDMSPYGLGALLVQIQKVEHTVIPYASRSLSQVKCQYSQTEWKALALV